MSDLDDLGLQVLSDGSLCRTDLVDRRYGRPGGASARKSDGRTETERDRARLGYSPSLRRLAGVTQVVSPDLRASHLHSRAAHTYKVALVSREIAETLIRRATKDPAGRTAELIARAGGLDATACEAAGLAHDLGHAPFGHAGEEALHRVMLLDLAPQAASPASQLAVGQEDGGQASGNAQNPLEDGFEGNPQSFRIVTHLEPYRVGRPGLDLTTVTLGGILKYPWTHRTGARKFGAYIPEEALFREVRGGLDLRTTDAQSLEASVMDLADDVAYAVHDLEDFLTAGVVNVGSVLKHLEQALAQVGSDLDFSESASDDPFTDEAKRLSKLYPELYDDEQYRDALNDARWLVERVHDADEPFAAIDLRTQLSHYVRRFFAAITLEPEESDGYPHAHLEGAAWHEMQCLKTITRRYVVGRSPMGLLQRSQYRVLEILYHEMKDWVNHLEGRRADLPAALQRFLEFERVDEYGGDEGFHSRVIVDYICTLSDADALQRARWLSGGETPSPTALGLQY